MTPEGRDPNHWRQFAELGLLAAPLPEEFGGLGGGPVESMVVMEEFGRALVVEPFVPTVVIAGGLLAKSGGALAEEEWLPKIAAGETIIAFAFAEAQSRYNLADIATTAKKQGGDYVLNGQKSVVLGAPWADHLIVTARTAAASARKRASACSWWTRSAKGVATRDYAAMSGLRAGEITFENVAGARLIGKDGEGFAALDAVVDHAIAAHLAEALGAIAVLMSATVDYAKTRKQFGQPIGKFQVLQHRMVDMFIAEQQARSAALMATLKLERCGWRTCRLGGQGGGRQICQAGRAKARCRFMAASA